MKSAWFVAGTDTEIGKTFASCALLHAARGAGRSAVGMKPVAAGADEHGCNEDVEALLSASSVALPRAWINPYLLRSPIAPHIAAAEEGIAIAPRTILDAYGSVSQAAEVVVVEGVGGFRVPLDERYDTADLACDLGLPVILVVGTRLGCISHALLTAEAIVRRGLPLAGWIANHIDPGMLRREENVAAIAARLEAPLLGVIPFLAHRDPAQAAPFLRLPSAPLPGGNGSAAPKD